MLSLSTAPKAQAGDEGGGGRVLGVHVPCCSLGGRNQTVSQLFLGVSLVRMSTLNCAMMETVQSMTLLDFLPHLLHRS